METRSASTTDRSVVFQLLCATVFTSMTIPRSGSKIGEIPITLPLVLYAVLLLFWISRPLGSIKLPTTRGSIFERIATLSAVGLIASGIIGLLNGLIHAENTGSTLVNSAAILGFVPIFFIVREVVNTKERLYKLCGIVILSITLVSIYGIVQKLFGHYRVMIPGLTVCYADAKMPDVFENKCNVTAVGLKVVSTFQNGNLLGVFLSLVMPLCVALSAYSNGRRRISYMLLANLVMLDILLTLSRGSTIAALFSLCVLAWYIRPSKTPVYFLAGYLWIGVAASIAMQLSERMLSYDPTGAGRISTYQALVDTYNSLPTMSFALTALFGAGMGAGVGFPADQITGIESSLLMILLSLGIVGLFLFMMAMYGGVRYATGVRSREDDQLNAIAFGLSAGVVGAIAQLAIDQAMMLPPTAMNLWIVLGLAVSAGSIIRSQRTETSRNLAS